MTVRVFLHFCAPSEHFGSCHTTYFLTFITFATFTMKLFIMHWILLFVISSRYSPTYIFNLGGSDLNAGVGTGGSGPLPLDMVSGNSGGNSTAANISTSAPLSSSAGGYPQDMAGNPRDLAARGGGGASLPLNMTQHQQQTSSSNSITTRNASFHFK